MNIPAPFTLEMLLAAIWASSELPRSPQGIQAWLVQTGGGGWEESVSSPLEIAAGCSLGQFWATEGALESNNQIIN